MDAERLLLKIRLLVVREWVYIAFLVITTIIFLIINAKMYFSFTFPFATDLGRFNQVMFNLVNNQEPIYTLTGQEPPFQHFFSEIHAMYGLYLLSPVYYFIQSPLTLVLLAILSVSVTGVVLAKTTTKILNSSKAGYLFLGLFVLNPSVLYLYTMGFRGSILAMLFLSLAIYFYVTDRLIPFLFAICIAILWKENIALVPAGFTFLALSDRRKWPWVVFPALLSLSYFVIFVDVLMGFGGANTNYWAHLGNSTGAILTTIVTEPLFIFNEITEIRDLVFYVKVLAPLGFLSLAAPRYLLVPASQWFIVASSSAFFHAHIGWWFQAPILPFVFIAAMVGLRRLKETSSAILKRVQFSSRLRRVDRLGSRNIILLIQTGLILLLFSALISGATSLGRGQTVIDDEANIDMITYNHISELPEDASITAQYPFTAHVSSRQEVNIFPYDIEDADYIIIDPDRQHLLNQTEYFKEVENLRENCNFHKITQGRPIIFKQINGTCLNAQNHGFEASTANSTFLTAHFRTSSRS